MTRQARAAARERGKVWYAAVITAAKRLAEAEAAGLRAPMSDLHRRSAERIKRLCGRNGGVYVKLGQQLSQMDFVVPSEFIEVLRSMLDQVCAQSRTRAMLMLALVSLVWHLRPGVLG